MKKKLFKIGEYALGGIISVEVSKESVTIQALDYITKEPVTEKRNFSKLNSSGYCEELENLTSYYYAEKIVNFIEN